MKFVSESLPVELIGMNSKLMGQYIKFIADRKFEMERMGQDPDALKMVRIRMRKTVKISRSLMPSLSLAERD